MVATSGARLISDDAIKTLTDELLPLAAVLTPNIPEAEVLSGMKISDEEGMIAIQIADYFILRRDVSSRRLFLPKYDRMGGRLYRLSPPDERRYVGRLYTCRYGHNDRTVRGGCKNYRQKRMKG